MSAFDAAVVATVGLVLGNIVYMKLQGNAWTVTLERCWFQSVAVWLTWFMLTHVASA